MTWSIKRDAVGECPTNVYTACVCVCVRGVAPRHPQTEVQGHACPRRSGQTEPQPETDGRNARRSVYVPQNNRAPGAAKSYTRARQPTCEMKNKQAACLQWTALVQNACERVGRMPPTAQWARRSQTGAAARYAQPWPAPCHAASATCVWHVARQVNGGSGVDGGWVGGDSLLLPLPLLADTPVFGKGKRPSTTRPGADTARTADDHQGRCLGAAAPGCRPSCNPPHVCTYVHQPAQARPGPGGPTGTVHRPQTQSCMPRERAGWHMRSHRGRVARPLAHSARLKQLIIDSQSKNSDPRGSPTKRG